jgi:hypothetical protein
MECDYCKNIFKTKYILQNHQKRAKYCLVKQKNIGRKTITDFYTCEYCLHEMASDHKSRHLKSCKRLGEKIKEEKDTQITELKLQVEKLQAQLDIYKDLALHNQVTVDEIAKQPRHQTTNTNNLLMMTPMDINKESFSKTIQDNFTKDYLLDGQKGAARFAVDKLLRDENGKLKYVCTDPSRQIYRFKTSDGVLERDVKAKKLTLALSGEMTTKSHSIAAREIDGDTDVFVLYTSNFQDIKDLSDDNGEFRSELATLTTV